MLDRRAAEREPAAAAEEDQPASEWPLLPFTRSLFSIVARAGPGFSSAIAAAAAAPPPFWAAPAGVKGRGRPVEVVVMMRAMTVTARKEREGN